MVIKMMVETCKTQDKLFIESGEKFENEEFEAALLHYSARDEDVAKEMQKYITKMKEL